MLLQENGGRQRPVWDYNRRMYVDVSTDPAPPAPSWGLPAQNVVPQGGFYNFATGQFVNPSAPASSVGGSAAGGAAGVGNTHNTISNVKDPAIDAAISAILGNVNSLTGAPSTKSTAVQSGINTALDSAKADATNNAQSVADFVTAWKGGDAVSKANQEQEAASVGKYYDGTVERELNALADKKNSAVQIAAGRAAGAARNRASFNDLRSGPSSYNDSLFAGDVSNIFSQAATADADLRRTNYGVARAGQDAMLGQRNTALDRLLMRGTVPITFGQQVAAADVNRLGQIGQMDAANNFYQSPEQALAAKVGLLGGLSNIKQQNTFYGLDRPYEPQIAGAVNPGWGPSPGSSGGMGARGNYGPAADAVMNGYSQQPTTNNPATDGYLPGAKVVRNGVVYTVGQNGELLQSWEPARVYDQGWGLPTNVPDIFHPGRMVGDPNWWDGFEGTPALSYNPDSYENVWGMN